MRIRPVALFIVYWWKRGEFDGVKDAIIYAVTVGLGFATVENFNYYGGAVMEGGAAGLAGLFVVRGILSPFTHPLFTSMTGIGLEIASRSDRRWVKIGAPVAGLLMAMDLHFLWNFSAVEASQGV